MEEGNSSRLGGGRSRVGAGAKPGAWGSDSVVPVRTAGLARSAVVVRAVVPVWTAVPDDAWLLRVAGTFKSAEPARGMALVPSSSSDSPCGEARGRVSTASDGEEFRTGWEGEVLGRLPLAIVYCFDVLPSAATAATSEHSGPVLSVECPTKVRKTG